MRLRNYKDKYKGVTPPRAIAAYDTCEINEQELQAWLFEYLLEAPDDIVWVLGLLREDLREHLLEFLKHLKPDTEVLLHRRMVRASPQLLLAVSKLHE